MGTVILEVGNVFTSILCEDKKLYEVLDREFAAFKPGYQRTWLYKSHRWDGKEHFVTGGRFRTGLFMRVQQFLRNKGCDVTTVDARIKPMAELGSWHVPSLDDKATPGQDWSHQIDACKHAVAQTRGVIFNATGTGKALALDTPLATPSGWTTMGEVQVGDRLFDEQGQVCNVTHTSDVMYGHDVFRVLFDDGAWVDADADHLWLTETKGSRQSKSRNAVNRQHPRIVDDALKTTEALRAGCGSRPDSIAVALPLQLPAIQLPIDPYILGCWLGDGTSATGAFTSADAEIVQAFEDAGFGPIRTTGKDPYYYGTAGLFPLLRALNLLHNKHIPSLYLRSSFEQRLALVQGLMDTDGYTSGTCEFTTTKCVLAEGMHTLLTGLGVKVRIIEARAKLYGKDCGPKYRLHFTTHLPVFRLPRKLSCQNLNTRSTQRRRFIHAVNPLLSVPVRCVAVDSPSRLYLAGKGMVPTHNTEVMARLAQRLNLKTLFLCDQKTIALQSADRFVERLRLDDKDVGRWASGKHTDGRIVCGTFQSFGPAIKRYAGDPAFNAWLASFDVLFVDEAHHLTGGSFQAVVDAVNAYYRFAFSATPFRSNNDDLTELHVVGSTGEVLHKFDAQDGIAAGILTPPRITMFNWHIDPAVGATVTPRYDWDREDFTLDDDLFEYGNRKSKRKGTMTDGLYTTGIINCDERNLAIVDAVRIFVSDDLPTLVLMDKVPHGKLLRDLIRDELNRDDIEFIHGTSSDTERSAALARLANREVPVLLANVIADEGLDVPAIGAMVLAGGQKAGHKMIQRLGRGMRLAEGKKVLEVVDFFDTHSKTFWLQSLARKKTYEQEGHVVTMA